jgi:hypothetical protein
VKSRKFNLHLQLPSRFRRFENEQRKQLPSREDNKENDSTLSLPMRLFTQAGPGTDIHHGGASTANKKFMAVVTRRQQPLRDNLEC